MGHGLSGGQDQAIFNPVAKLLGITFNELGLQRLAFGAELEGHVVEPNIAVEVSVALDLSETPFTVGLGQIETSCRAVALEERGLGFEAVSKFLGAIVPCANCRVRTLEFSKLVLPSETLPVLASRAASSAAFWLGLR